MKPGGVFQACVFAVMLLSVAAYAFAEPLPALLLLWLPLAGAGWWFSRHGGRALPPLGTGVLILIAICFGAWRAMESQLNVSTFSQFLAALLVIKTTERAQPRDYGLMLALSVFMCLGAILTSNALIVAMPVALALTLLVVSTMLLQVEAGRFHARQRKLQLGIVPGDDPAGPTWRLIGASLGSLAVGLLISVIVFVAFPRGLGAGQLGEWSSDLLSRRTGFTEVVRLGLGGNITQSQVAVLDVRFADRDGRVLGGPGQVFYLRGAALDEYIDGSWRRGPRQYEEDNLLEGAPVNVPESSRRTIRMTQATTLRSAARNGPVFLAWQPIRVRPTGGSDRFVLTPETLTVRRDGGSGMVSYEADLAWPRPDPDVVYERFGASFDSEVVHRHALEALAAAGVEPDPAKREVVDDQRAARAIEGYLSKRFAYSLQAGASPIGSDPIDWFLDVRKAGHCEYFASAMAAMCRSVGMESRVIAGYVATEWNEAQSGYVVRESNAHAWTEVEIGGGYWMTCDPSPQDELRAVQRGNDRLSSWFGRFLDDMNYAWNRGVVAFDENRRVSLLGAEIASPLSGSPLLRWLVARMRPSPTEARSTAIARGLMLFFGVLAVGAGVVLGGRMLSRMWNRLRGRSTPRAAQRSVDPWQRGLLRVLARRAGAKPYWRPLLMHVDQVTMTDADRVLARRVAWASYRSRFGLGLNAQERADASDALRRLESRA